MVHKVTLISVSLAFSQTPVYTAKPQIWMHWKLHLFFFKIKQCSCPASAGTHCIYAQGDGQAEWVAGYVRTWFIHLPMITDPSTN